MNKSKTVKLIVVSSIIVSASMAEAVSFRSLFGGKPKPTADRAVVQGHVAVDQVSSNISVGHNANLRYNKDGVEVQVNLPELLSSVRNLGSKINSLKQSGSKDPSILDLIAKLELSQKLLPEFIKLSENTSSNTAPLELAALARQLDLIKESMSEMSALELGSHLDIVQQTLSVARSSNLPADKAYVKVLESKYGSKLQEKLEEILSCK